MNSFGVITVVPGQGKQVPGSTSKSAANTAVGGGVQQLSTGTVAAILIGCGIVVLAAYVFWDRAQKRG